MSLPLILPRLGVSMTEGSIVTWHVGDGDRVRAGQALYRLETEKVEQDVEAPVDGVLRVLVRAGGPYPVGTQVGSIET
jgi:pyruvate dehydrogenase E2 component (dihydrolipoamide acetyltransferase)